MIPLINSVITELSIIRETLSERYYVNKLDRNTFPPCMVIARSLLPQNDGNLPLTFFGVIYPIVLLENNY